MGETDTQVLRPLLLCDIDGALSPMIDLEEPEGAKLVRVCSFVGVVPELRSWMDELKEHFELVWATSWEDEANEMFGPGIGLVDLPVIHFTKGVMDDTAKLANVKEFVKDRAFAWIDDVLHDDAFWFAKGHPHGALLIRTKALEGITREHVDELIAFAKKVTLPTSV